MRRVAAGFFFVVAMLLSLQPAFGRGGHDYADALEKSILFFEGQRSGKLPPSQRMGWRGDSGLHDGDEIGVTSLSRRRAPPRPHWSAFSSWRRLWVDLVGGYYDAGDNIKFGFPMAFTTTVLSWSIVEFGRYMGPQLPYARDAVRWATDYLLKATADPTRIHVQVGDPFADHACWERPEDMDTPRTVYTVDAQKPGSEVAAETAAALAAASIVFKSVDRPYAAKLLNRSIQVFGFADAHRGSYNLSVGKWVTEFYCDYSGYQRVLVLGMHGLICGPQDELVWAAAWMYKATNNRYYRDYVADNIQNLYNVGEFGWDDKSSGVYVFVTKNSIVPHSSNPQEMADGFVCAMLPESPSRTVDYSPGASFPVLYSKFN
ncbi:hypothetical protein Taro_020420 [Colocasia esculenta]|uniref:cellulase n=1 Tax=Colocasia esculenta TaxID=4460 RepID=A0A843V299_COLES|nr:hypothetical protein [Colocasia esculenta]